MTISSVNTLPVTADNIGGKGIYEPVAQVTSISVAQKTSGVDVVPSPERVAQAVKQVNDAFDKQGQNIYASIEKDKASGLDVVKVYDKKTNEEVSQFPSKAIVAIADAINQSNDGKVQLMHASA